MDRVYENRKTIRNIQLDNVEIEAKNIFVIEPYSGSFESDKVSTLLANGNLRFEYGQIISKINKTKDELVKLLKDSSGLKKGIEETFSKDFLNREGYFLESLNKIENDVKNYNEISLADISYAEIFNEKVITFLAKNDTNLKIQNYIIIYETLLEDSMFFKKGVFNHTHASNVSSSLKTNGFFGAKHSLLINDEKDKREITNIEDLETLIISEKEKILNDAKLKQAFDEIDKQLSNQNLRDFRDYIMNNKVILPELKDLERLKKKLWISYLATNMEAYKKLMDVYKEGKEEITDLISRASSDFTQWNKVVEIFNQRFSVPFKVGVKNQQNVILKGEEPAFVFEFEDKNELKEIEKNALVNILSNGEKRALYLLDIIFEVEARKKMETKTLFIVDDVADSFDYKNKYAIIEYLKDIMDYEHFYLVILTHNYDFYRTVSSRLSLGGARYLTTKDEEVTSFVVDSIYRTPFEKSINMIKKNGAENHFFIALIPYVRNLSEYCGLNEEELFLTSILHLKENTKSINVNDVISVFNKVLNLEIEPMKENYKILEKIYLFSNNISSEKEFQVSDIEKKIILSIGIRLKIEEVLIRIINDNEFVLEIDKNQTAELLSKVKGKISLSDFDFKAIEIAERVSLMTPENIHINSFMYEPILDLSSHHLIRLYEDVCKLENEQSENEVIDLGL